MGTASFVEDFKEALQFCPVEGEPSRFLIQTPAPHDDKTSEDMTAEDWNEFERHITDAFELVP
jgi:hypothetical protein